MVRPIRRVLLTGAAGRMGQELRRRLAGRFALLRVSDIGDLGDPAPGEQCLRFDLADAQATRAACEGMDAVIHCGGIAREAGWDALIPANLVGVVNLYEAARLEGVDRVLFSSSNHATGLYRRKQRLDHASPARPDSRYGITKAFGEDMAFTYAWKHGVRGFCMRIGHFAPVPTTRRALSIWLSPGDLERLVTTGLEADYIFEIVYGVSRNSRSWWDNSRAHALGYDPQDDAEAHAAGIADAASSPDAVSEQLQGSLMAADGFSGDMAALP